MVAFTQEPDASAPPLETLFHAKHLARQGHMVPFAGWHMPLYYPATGIVAEHKAVREGVGLFDVSHMSIVTVTGSDAAELISLRTPTNAHLLKPGVCRYTMFLNVDGAILDDAVVTRMDQEAKAQDFLLVSNAALAARVLELLLQHRLAQSDLDRWNGRVGILAVQGPKSTELLRKVFGWDHSVLKFYTAGFFPWKGGPKAAFSGSFDGMWKDHILVSRTGYTGEVGYELFVPAAFASEAWDRITGAGAVPCGLGCRDSLRMEKGYLLSGTDFHGNRSPLEAGLDKFLAFDHKFVGRPALEQQKAEAKYPVFTGLLVDAPGAIPRHGAKVYDGPNAVAEVTSGGLSPTLQKGISLTYLPPALRTEGRVFEVEIRGHRTPGTVVSLPFVK